MTDTQSRSRARATFAVDAEIDDLVTMLGRYERREIDAEAWRAYRVVRGTYSQRQDGVHMLRVKLPQGVAEAAQLRALAEVARRWSRGWGHVTTRQNFQFHFLRPADLEPALRRLAEAGITSAGAGGNAVRNVVACPLAGVARDEAFDVTPYAEAVTRHFLRHPLGSSLPRKFKIAFDGCGHDHARTAIQDLGFRARVRPGDGARGFSVTVAGGTSSLCTSGTPLVDFLPADDVLALVEAAVRVFHARGDRKNKARNRLKFLVRELGFDTFRALLEVELAAVCAGGALRLQLDPAVAPQESPPVPARVAAPAPEEIAARVAASPLRGPGEPPRAIADLAPTPEALEAFRRAQVEPQRQAGFAVVTVAAPQGDLTAAQLEVLADLAMAYGEGTVRFSSAGQVHLRWVRLDDVAPLHACLAAAGLARIGAGSAADVVSCPGSEACRLAVTHTRGIAQLAAGALQARLPPEALAERISVHVSGCPNGCSQHHVAAIGLQGSARKVGGRAAPQYFVLAGGGSGEGARFGRLVAKVPARRVPSALERLVRLYLAEREPGEEASEFFARTVERAKAVLAPLEELRPEDATTDDFVEPGTSALFHPDTQEGECAA